MKRIYFTPIKGQSAAYYVTLAIFAFLFLAGMFYTFLMYEYGLGEYTGMTSRVPWGLGIIMAIYYIGISAGSLVISALSSVFGQKEYKPFSRMGALLSVLLIIAALMSIMLDWGRPDRFVNPFIYLNPTSMFSINSFFYSSYIMIGIAYLAAMFSGNEKWVKRIALLAVIWAVGVHSGTGYIFGSTPRELYESPLLAPSFVVAALSSGTAALILIIQLSFRVTKRALDLDLMKSLSRLLFIFILVVFYFVLVENLFRSYLPRSQEAEWFFLFGGHFHEVMNGDIATAVKAFFNTDLGIHHLAFWGGLMLLGTFIPALILGYSKTKNSIKWINFASLAVVIGVLCERYIIVIPGQTVKKELLPGWDITSKTIMDGIAQYHMSTGEIVQAIGIGSFVVLGFMLVIKFLPMLPTEAKAIDTDEESENSES